MVSQQPFDVGSLPAGLPMVPRPQKIRLVRRQFARPKEAKKSFSSWCNSCHRTDADVNLVPMNPTVATAPKPVQLVTDQSDGPVTFTPRVLFANALSSIINSVPKLVSSDEEDETSTMKPAPSAVELMDFPTADTLTSAFVETESMMSSLDQISMKFDKALKLSDQLSAMDRTDYTQPSSITQVLNDYFNVPSVSAASWRTPKSGGMSLTCGKFHASCAREYNLEGSSSISSMMYDSSLMNSLDVTDEQEPIATDTSDMLWCPSVEALDLVMAMDCVDTPIFDLTPTPTLCWLRETLCGGVILDDLESVSMQEIVDPMCLDLSPIEKSYRKCSVCV